MLSLIYAASQLWTRRLGHDRVEEHATFARSRVIRVPCNLDNHTGKRSVARQIIVSIHSLKKGRCHQRCVQNVLGQPALVRRCEQRHGNRAGGRWPCTNQWHFICRRCEERTIELLEMIWLRLTGFSHAHDIFHINDATCDNDRNFTCRRVGLPNCHIDSIFSYSQSWEGFLEYCMRCCSLRLAEEFPEPLSYSRVDLCASCSVTSSEGWYLICCFDGGLVDEIAQRQSRGSPQFGQPRNNVPIPLQSRLRTAGYAWTLTLQTQ
jgi:hypothetical protein